MQFAQPRLCRALAASLLVVAAFASPGGASAQSFDPGTLVNAYASPDVYSLDPTTGYVNFGDGEAGQRVPYGGALSASCGYGQGAAGNVSSEWSTDVFSCFFWNC